ncbi:MAG: ATP-binding protein [Tissierellales bacterium]
MNPSIFENLTFNAVKEEFDKRKLEFTKIQMENLGIITSDGTYTNMGLLVSDQCKHSIKFAVFQGEDKSISRNRKEFKGSIFSQLRDVYNIIDFYNGTKASFHGLLRTDIRDYPEDAVREVLLNAIVHRDYSFSGSTLINLFTDRLEIVSLGGLVPGLSLEAAMLGASQTRNEKLAALFYRLKLIEAYGTGISKIISSYRNSELKPVFENVKGAFRVILPNVNIESKYLQVNEIEEEYIRYLPVLELFTNQKIISRRQVEEVMGLGPTQAVNIINELLDKNLIKRIGTGKATRYIKVSSRLDKKV